MAQTEKILNLANGIIAQELLNHEISSACLATALMFYDQAKRIGAKVDVVCGSTLYDSKLPIPLHFWCLAEGGKIYDTSPLFAEKVLGADVNKWTYIPNGQSVSEEDQVIMMDFYKDFQQSKSTKKYFDAAPASINAIRSKAHKRVTSLLKRYNL